MEDLDTPTFHAAGQKPEAAIQHAVEQIPGEPLYFMMGPALWKSLAQGRPVKTIMNRRYNRAALFQDERTWASGSVLLVPDRDVRVGEAEVRRDLTGPPVARVVFD